MDMLTHLGEKTEYKYTGPSPAVLECFPNPSDGPLVVSHSSAEFTSLCPKTGQPDFARIQIVFVPDKLCVETKSLKLYLVSFRNYGSFMEAIGTKIYDDLWAVMRPKCLRVVCQFNARGGIPTTVLKSSHAAQDGDEGTIHDPFFDVEVE